MINPNWWKWVLGIIIAVYIFVGIWYFLSRCLPPKEEERIE